MTTPIATANTINAFELRVISSQPLLAALSGHLSAGERTFKPIFHSSRKPLHELSTAPT
jgi:hypothetical protein